MMADLSPVLEVIAELERQDQSDIYVIEFRREIA